MFSNKMSVESPWKQWTKSVESMDKIHGQCPAGVLERKQWTISSDSMENVHGFFPVCPWIFSSMSMDFFHGIHGFFSREIVDNVHGNYPWTMSMDNVHGKNPWTLSMESMDIVHYL